jgi:hypothetical protein
MGKNYYVWKIQTIAVAGKEEASLREKPVLGYGQTFVSQITAQIFLELHISGWSSDTFAYVLKLSKNIYGTAEQFWLTKQENFLK